MGHSLGTRLLGCLSRWRDKGNSSGLDPGSGLRTLRGLMLGRRLELPEEARLEMARRHVWLGETYVTRQAQILEQLLATGMEVERAEALLVSHLEFLRVAREHLRRIEDTLKEHAG